MMCNSCRYDVTSNIMSTNLDVCLFATSLDNTFNVGKSLHWQMKTVTRLKFIEGKTVASVNIVN